MTHGNLVARQETKVTIPFRRSPKDLTIQEDPNALISFRSSHSQDHTLISFKKSHSHTENQNESEQEIRRS